MSKSSLASFLGNGSQTPGRMKARSRRNMAAFFFAGGEIGAAGLGRGFVRDLGSGEKEFRE